MLHGKRIFSGIGFSGRDNPALKTLYGENDHHKTEALFKAFAHALKEAVTRTGEGVFPRKECCNDCSN